MKFWDASAIIPLLFQEPATEAIFKLLEEDPSVLVWWSAPVECVSAIARREREGALKSKAAGEALGRLRWLSEGWQEILPDAAIRSTAQRLLRMHPLRAADSLQLAAAIIAAEHEPSTLDFVCLDQRLALAATREGFRVLGGAAGP